MKEVLQTHYQGAELCLELTSIASENKSLCANNHGGLAATLRVNGITRDEASSQSNTSTLRLTSTVQTDYEWHEFIEAVVYVTDATVNMRLLASNTEVANLTAPRT
jgi:hypothetical protein